jgi:hypothetical protein
LFHEYLLRGCFSQSAQVESIPLAQKLLREEIVDNVLKWDMTALFGVRRVLVAKGIVGSSERAIPSICVKRILPI